MLKVRVKITKINTKEKNGWWNKIMIHKKVSWAVLRLMCLVVNHTLLLVWEKDGKWMKKVLLSRHYFTGLEKSVKKKKLEKTCKILSLLSSFRSLSEGEKETCSSCACFSLSLWFSRNRNKSFEGEEPRMGMRKREGMEKGRMRNVKSQLHSERERRERGGNSL